MRIKVSTPTAPQKEDKRSNHHSGSREHVEDFGLSQGPCPSALSENRGSLACREAWGLVSTRQGAAPFYTLDWGIDAELLRPLPHVRIP